MTKEKVIDYIKENNIVTPSQISGILHINFYELKGILEELEKEKVISIEEKGKFRYIKIKEKRK